MFLQIARLEAKYNRMEARYQELLRRYIDDVRHSGPAHAASLRTQIITMEVCRVKTDTFRVLAKAANRVAAEGLKDVEADMLMKIRIDAVLENLNVLLASALRITDGIMAKAYSDTLQSVKDFFELD